MEKSLTLSQIKQYLSSVNSQTKSDTILKAQEFLKEYEITLERFLGVGGFGIVLQAQDNRNKRAVAVKIIVCQDNNMVTESIMEFQKMKLLNSQNVIASYDIYYDQDNEAIYHISEFGSNGDLGNFYKVNKPLSQQLIIQIFGDIVEGLKAIHAKNVIHADLKPANIILSNSNIPKICDFGLSKRLVDKSHTLNKGLTPTYAPKEQMEGKVYKQSDLYSAGMVLCLLCGLEIENNMLLSFQMKEGKFPDISNHKNKELLEIAFLMMNPDYLQRIALDKVKQMLNNLEENTQVPPSNQKKVEHESAPNKEVKQMLNNVEENTEVPSNLKKVQHESDLNKEVKNGFWTYYSLNGQRYEGYYKNDKKNGKGKEFFPNGNTYEGDWREDKKNGFGVFLFSKEKDRYEGQFQNGIFNGKGKYLFADGNYYDGEWIKGKREGFGIQSCKNGDKYEGYWKDDFKQGKGKQLCASGNYDGEWIKGNKEGFGIYSFNNGDKYEGYWNDDFKQGKGKYIYASEDYYDGEWIKNQKEGFGIYQYNDGERYEGNFKNDQKNGKGKLIYAHGSIYEGEWKDGKMI